MVQLCNERYTKDPACDGVKGSIVMFLMKVQPVRPGRPRAFDEDAALEKAMCVFWRKGFEATSMADLTEAMGINPPSLYAAFGNKESLFLRVLERYAEGPAGFVMKALAAPTAREVAERRLYGAVDSLRNSERPPGCLVVLEAARCSNADDPIGQKLSSFCDAAHQAFVKRFKRAKAEGDLPKNADPVALARYLGTVAQGIAVQAASGASRSELRKVVEIALRQWPQ
jgi:AcrR family transcriptional regulator